MDLGSRMGGGERGSSVEQLGGWERDTEGLSCSEPSAHAVVVAPVESDAGGAEPPGLCSVSEQISFLYFASLLVD